MGLLSRPDLIEFYHEGDKEEPIGKLVGRDQPEIDPCSGNTDAQDYLQMVTSVVSRQGILAYRRLIGHECTRMIIDPSGLKTNKI